MDLRQANVTSLLPHTIIAPGKCKVDAPPGDPTESKAEALKVSPSNEFHEGERHDDAGAAAWTGEAG